MDYCSAHFGKRLEDLKIEDLQNYFLTERIETDQLEFKSINPVGNILEKFVAVERTVCAFLNSIGGLLIWGAPKGVNIDLKKTFHGDLTFFDQVLEKDFIVSKISDNITPLPNQIRCKVFPVPNKCVILIEVDQSKYPPHQTKNTYFMRIDGQTRPAPHHYIEALFKKITYPNIEVFLKISTAGVYEDPQTGNNLYRLDIKVMFFNWSPFQNEEQVFYRMITSNGIFLNSRSPTSGLKYKLKGQERFEPNLKSILYFGEPILESETIIYDPVVLRGHQNKSKIIITFGGKFSPMKASTYDLDFANFYSGDPQKIIINKKENILTIDAHNETGQTREKIIAAVLDKL